VIGGEPSVMRGWCVLVVGIPLPLLLHRWRTFYGESGNLHLGRGGVRRRLV